MSIQAIEGTSVYVVYFWDGHNDEWEVCSVCATERSAKEEARRRNNDFLDDDEKDILTEEGEIDWSRVDGGSRYYHYVRTNLII